MIFILSFACSSQHHYEWMNLLKDRSNARIARLGGHKQIWGGGHENFISLNSKVWTKKLRCSLRILTNSGAKMKKKNVLISKTTRFSTDFWPSSPKICEFPRHLRRKKKKRSSSEIYANFDEFLGKA